MGAQPLSVSPKTYLPLSVWVWAAPCRLYARCICAACSAFRRGVPHQLRASRRVDTLSSMNSSNSRSSSLAARMSLCHSSR